MSTPLEDYALLADLHTGPLVSREGSIDWLCFPRFDSPAVFCALLGDEENGRWKLSAVDGEVVSWRYIPGTFILETEWKTPTGRVLVTDFLPPSDDHADLVRRVECLEGTVQVEHDLRFRFDYGRMTPWVRRVELGEDTGAVDCARMGTSAQRPHPAGTSAVPHPGDGDRAASDPDARHGDWRETHQNPGAEPAPFGARVADGGLDGDVPHDDAAGTATRGHDGQRDIAQGGNSPHNSNSPRNSNAPRENSADGTHAPHWYRGFRQRVHHAAHAAESRNASGTGLLAVAGPDALLLTGPALEAYQVGRDGKDVADAHGPGVDIRELQDLHRGHGGRFTLAEGERLDWVLTWSESYRELLVPADPEQAQRATEEFWREWTSAVECVGGYEELVTRSLLVLRALTHSETGGIVAAPTTSLPEDFGGERNWDYRYTWLRDAALTIQVLVNHGHQDGALLWRDWLLRAVAGNPDQLKILFGVDGRRNLTEYELDHLSGYENSRPVRTGNGAEDQYQADVAGEVMLALATLRDAGLEENDYSWGLQQNLMSFCELHMDTPDNGIWEMRGEPHFFTHGRVMMWAAFNEGLRAAAEHDLPGDVQRWTRLRDQLHDEIWEKGYDRELGVFTQTYDGQEVDASLLQLPQTGFIAADHPAMLRTVERIEKDLQGADGQVWRYRTSDDGESVDGLSGHESPFVICTFWLVEQYARSGQLEKAHELMRTTTGFATELGLLSEEYDVERHRLAGNFPQAFSHLGLIRAADALLAAGPRRG